MLEHKQKLLHAISSAYEPSLRINVLQGDAAALQVLAREWATGAAPEPPGSDPGGEDQRWRVLTITGHGIDVGVRHTAGMRELAEQRIEPGMNRCLSPVDAYLPLHIRGVTCS